MAQLACLTMIYRQYSFAKALESIARAGYKHAAVWPRHEDQDIFDGGLSLERVRSSLRQYGLTPVMLFSHTQFEHDQPVETAHQQIDYAYALGIPEINILSFWGYHRFPDQPIVGAQYEELDRRTVEHLQIIARYAEARRITISIKPHTANTATGKEISRLLGRIGSPVYKACYDPGNILYYQGISPEADLKEAVAETVSIIAKDQRGGLRHPDFPVPGEGDVDFPNLFKQLREVGFNGPVVIEKVDSAGENLPAEQLDQRILRARINMEAALLQAGLALE